MMQYSKLYVRELYSAKGLKRCLSTVSERANELLFRLESSRHDYSIAQEIVNETILGPSQPDFEEIIGEEEQQEILRSLGL